MIVNIITGKTEEERRLDENVGILPPWEKWGPYVAERSWGTVREDYSENGDSWNFFSHDLATSKVYRWGEDGIAGWCDRYQVLVFSPAFWNGHDPILKERLFGLANSEGNHGEDVKEYYYYLDATPSHSYMKFLYKYPQTEFPYARLREENKKRGQQDSEFELIDTGVLDQNRYFDIFVEYAKASAEDLCIRIEAFNRGDRPACLHIVPQLFFRNQWSWKDEREPEPIIYLNSQNASTAETLCLIADDRNLLSPATLTFDYHLGQRYLYAPAGGEVLFTNNETQGIYITQNSPPYFKDAFHRHIIHHDQNAVSLVPQGTKAGLHYVFEIPAHQSAVLRLRLVDHEIQEPLQTIDDIVNKRRQEADEFYDSIHPAKATAEEKKIQRQAFAGMIWTKQIYLFDVNLWLKGDNTYYPPPSARIHIRNQHWRHLNSMRILSMPDKWEYPYFCAWDQAFHAVTFGLIDIKFAKEQLWLLLFDQFQHPNGQIPACEWDFSVMNPPVQSWAILYIYFLEKERHGVTDQTFLKKCFNKLLINFAWWVNKVDSEGHNIFEGGFLGLDNITVVDRSKKLANGVKLQQSDGTAWMAVFCLNLMRMALELAKNDPAYEGMATKFFQHFVYIAHAMKRVGNQHYEMWSDKDGFFYDVLTYPDGAFAKFRLRSLVGLIPLYAVEILSSSDLEQFPNFARDFHWFLKNRPDLIENCVIPTVLGNKSAYLLALVNKDQLKRVLSYVWHPEEFRAKYGLRSLSRYHEQHPFVYFDKKVGYEAAESSENLMGGNSNWRGPVWFPTTFLLIESLQKLSTVLGDQFTIQVDQEESVSLQTMALSFALRMTALFQKDEQGIVPCLGKRFSLDPHFMDYLFFYEYFNPETGKGLGASHQTGWTGLVANLIDQLRR